MSDLTARENNGLVASLLKYLQSCGDRYVIHANAVDKFVQVYRFVRLLVKALKMSSHVHSLTFQ